MFLQPIHTVQSRIQIQHAFIRIATTGHHLCRSTVPQAWNRVAEQPRDLADLADLADLGLLNSQRPNKSAPIGSEWFWYSVAEKFPENHSMSIQRWRHAANKNMSEVLTMALRVKRKSHL